MPDTPDNTPDNPSNNPLIEPAPQVDRTLIREWIIDRIKTDQHLLAQYHENAMFHARIARLAQTDNNQEATDCIIAALLEERTTA